MRKSAAKYLQAVCIQCGQFSIVLTAWVCSTEFVYAELSTGVGY